MLFSAGSAAAVFNSNKQAASVEAAETTNYPRNGASGNLLYVNGSGTYFKSGEAKLAICCWDNSTSAWSDAVDYRCFNDMLSVMIPYKDGQAKTWSYFKVCRYNPNMDPKVSGDYGVYNETDSISFGNMQYAQNTVNITGYGSGNRINYSWSTANYYGIKAKEHIYLDLSGFTDWEQGDAKFALWFGAPSYFDESRWGTANSTGGYYSSFCWKVNGQDNDHLYECIVPAVNDLTIWNFVKAVRINPIAGEPNWDNKWNETQDLHFNSTNHTLNMIHVNGWNSAELDSENIISRETRMEFFGRYFINTIKCSGDGESDATTSNMWDALKYEYQSHLASNYQGDFWLAEADEDGTLLEQAAVRYDYIVFYKQYAHEDFVNRAESPNKSSRYLDVYYAEFDSMPSILIVAISISIASVALILLLKAKHRRYKNY